jgi:hypothetical protein
MFQRNVLFVVDVAFQLATTGFHNDAFLSFRMSHLQGSHLAGMLLHIRGGQE